MTYDRFVCILTLLLLNMNESMMKHWDDMGFCFHSKSHALFNSECSHGSRCSPNHPRPVKKEKRRPAPLALTERAASRGGIPNRRCNDGWQRAAGILTRVAGQILVQMEDFFRKKPERESWRAELLGPTKFLWLKQPVAVFFYLGIFLGGMFFRTYKSSRCCCFSGHPPNKLLQNV